MLDRTATAWLQRLLTWLELFEDGFARQSQRGALRRYVTGLLSDSRRKSMEAMWARLSDPGTYQAFQHFITHAPWEADAVWMRLREVVPDRTGVLILDGTSFPKQGPASVGVARQYCGARGKIANCQTAVTVALWTGRVGSARRCIPEDGSRRGSEPRGSPPSRLPRNGSWPGLVAPGHAAGYRRRWAAMPSSATTRPSDLASRALPTPGVSPTRLLTGLEAPPPSIAAGTVGGAGGHAVPKRAPAAAQPPRMAPVSWRNDEPGVARPLGAVRVAGHDWRECLGSRPKSLLCERGWAAGSRPPAAGHGVVAHPALAHQRWAIEQQNQEPKDESGARSLRARPARLATPPLTAIAYSSNTNGDGADTPAAGSNQEVLTAHFFMTSPAISIGCWLKDVQLRIYQVALEHRSVNDGKDRCFYACGRVTCDLCVGHGRGG